MTQFLMPLILVGASVGLFVGYINPHYQNIKTLQVKERSYDEALTKSNEIKKTLNDKNSLFNTFSQEDKDRLETFLPNNVDNIQLVIDINSVAANRGLVIKDLQMGSSQDSKASRSAAAVGSGTGAIGSVDLGFSVSADFDTFIIFLQDLEHSLRLIDVQKIAVSATKTGVNEYGVTIRTYWLH